MVRLFAIIYAMIVPLLANAAEIEVIDSSSYDIKIISVAGEFVQGDDQKFIRLALPIEKAIVVFQSDGGNLIAGLGIGRAIRLKEFMTLVPEGGMCASACGLAWLGGYNRHIGEGARLGFHAAYIESNGESKETGVGNALVGAYLNQLGLSQSAIAYVTIAAPHEMKWLTVEDAKGVGIEMSLLASQDAGSAAPKTTGNIPSKFPTHEPPSENFKRVTSADIFGYDLPSMPIKNTTIFDCERACLTNVNCKAYTFNRRNSACFLKSNGSRVLGNPLADAGYKIEIEASLHASSITVFERTDLPGGDYKSTSDTTFEQCTDLCESDDKCASFTYSRRSATCWLKSSVPTAQPTMSVISGVKAER